MVIIKQDLIFRAAGYVIISVLAIFSLVLIVLFIYYPSPLPTSLPIFTFVAVSILLGLLNYFQISFPRIYITDKELIVQNYLQRRGSMIKGKLIYKFKLEEIDRAIICRGGHLKEFVDENVYKKLYELGKVGLKTELFTSDDQALNMRILNLSHESLFLCVLMKNSDIKLIFVNNFENGKLILEKELKKKGVEVLKNTIPLGVAFPFSGRK